MIKTTMAATLVAFGAFALVAPIAHAATLAGDTDNDGTISLAEAQTAGAAKFTMVDADHEGTVDAKEMGMDVTALDPDKDGTVSKDEYAAGVEAAFKKADPDNDGTVDAKELASPAGESLAAMIK